MGKKCEVKNEPVGIDGFFCPEEDVLGPHGQKLAHPSFPHPTSCQKFITCYFGKDIKELGCMKGQVFDHESGKCKIPEEGPADCQFGTNVWKILHAPKLAEVTVPV